jgi:hypothetical protein
MILGHLTDKQRGFYGTIVVGRHSLAEVSIWRSTMTEKTRFHILTPEGAIPPDTFILADEQPKNILEGCLLVIHEATRRQLTVHRTRLIPVNDPAVASLKHKHSICSKCGKVEGIVLDNVPCPNHHGINCGLLEITTTEKLNQ